MSSEKPEGAAGEGEGEGSLPLCGDGALCLSASPCAPCLSIPLLFSGFRPSLCLPLQEAHCLIIPECPSCAGLCDILRERERDRDREEERPTERDTHIHRDLFPSHLDIVNGPFF